MNFEIKKCSVLDAGADIIVNAANNGLQAGGGVCGAIFDRAGYNELQEECNALAPIATGDVVITKGYNSGADYIIHAVGPSMWMDRCYWEKKLQLAYWNSLMIADKYNGNIIAFPCISTGIYGCPLKQSAEIAISTVRVFNATNLQKVILCCFTEEEYEVYMDIVNNL